MKREFVSSHYGTVGVTVRENAEWWTKMLKEAEAKQDEAFRRFHDWFYGLMDPEEEQEYTDAFVLRAEGFLSEMRH